MKKFEIPEFKKEAFNCPNCSAYAKHDWTHQEVDETAGTFYREYGKKNHSVFYIYLCKCSYCGYISFWYKEKLIYPLQSIAEPPIDGIPDDIRELYNEASSILELSPKGACAILRLALQKLCNRLAGVDEKGKIDSAIKKLVENGLPSKLQKAMDTVRIVGDEAVHPGEIMIDDNKQLAVAMFSLINIIIEKMIIEPKEIDSLYNMMPEHKIEGINNRDKYSKKCNSNELKD